MVQRELKMEIQFSSFYCIQSARDDWESKLKKYSKEGKRVQKRNEEPKKK